MRGPGQLLRVGLDLLPELVVLGLDVVRVDGDEESQRSRPLDVAKKLEAQTLTLRSALDDPRNVRHHKGTEVRKPHHPQIRGEGGKWIVGHLWVGFRDGRQEGGLSGVRLSNQPYIGDELQLQLDLSLLPLLPRFPSARSLVGGGSEPGIPPTSPTAPGHEQPVPPFQELPQEHAGLDISDHRARRHSDLDGFSGASGTIAPLTMLAPLSFVVEPAGDVQQGGQLGIGHENHVPSLPSVSSRGPTPGDTFLPSERFGPGTSGSSLDMNHGTVHEHDGLFLPIGTLRGHRPQLPTRWLVPVPTRSTSLRILRHSRSHRKPSGLPPPRPDRRRR